MLNRMFGRGSKGGGGGGSGDGQTVDTLGNLKETLSMLEKRETLLQKRAEEELHKAKIFTQQKNKRAALQCLKRKKMYESQADQVANNQLRVHEQIMMLEGATAATQTVKAMRQGASAMKQLQKETNIDDVDKIMDEINEQTDNMKQIQEALGTPIGDSEFDDEELDRELQDLEAEQVDEQLLAPALPPMTAQPAPMPSAPVAQPAAKTKEEEELEALEAEMALAA
mmetsp:Transcript_4814/g.5607  ORF Transcript_4814/g.5607 Transcript_4814/m.5607 type:complete len:226 (-) Transcript_4814:497-1174(-)|eukprot:CAMPEP_0197864684 /NCGR_PEP_ID=MMETSP1438-20131217/43117_1 /TAXON_ID=1461541 /ORGANISM="Pterosperma sp., Strain CCMP1384" /LENGTH=225 /DNA_ID=CAMNT_0043483027 /DNA_START=284 /DNA_END=961 /DNA_ORIENTATION=-